MDVLRRVDGEPRFYGRVGPGLQRSWDVEVDLDRDRVRVITEFNPTVVFDRGGDEAQEVASWLVALEDQGTLASLRAVPTGTGHAIWLFDLTDGNRGIGLDLATGRFTGWGTAP